MPWVVTISESTAPPKFQIGRFPNWASDVPDRKIRADVSQAFHYGDHLIDLSAAPKLLEVDTKPSELPDIFRSCDGIKIISSLSKKVIDSLPPQGNQIFPIEIKSPVGKGQQAWYVLNVVSKKQSVIRDGSSVKPHFAYKDSWKVAYIDHEAPDRKLRLTRDALKGPHLWREAGYARSLLISDELKAAFDKEGIDLYDTWRADIID